MEREEMIRQLQSIEKEIEISHADCGTGEEFEIIDGEGVSTGVVQDQLVSTCNYTAELADLAGKLIRVEYDEQSAFDTPLGEYLEEGSTGEFTPEEIQKTDAMDADDLENVLFLRGEAAEPGHVYWIVHDISADQRSFYLTEAEARDAQIMSSIEESREWDELSDEELKRYLQYLPEEHER